MKVPTIDCAAPSAQPEEMPFAEPGPGLFCKKPGGRVAGGDALVSPMNVGPIERRLINTDQGMFLSPGDPVVGVCQDGPSSKLVIIVEVMPPSECWFRIDKLSVLNTQQLGSTIVFSTGISDAGASNVHIRLRVDGAWKAGRSSTRCFQYTALGCEKWVKVYMFGWMRKRRSRRLSSVSACVGRP